jgi:hypothetical protein
VRRRLEGAVERDVLSVVVRVSPAAIGQGPLGLPVVTIFAARERRIYGS